jgi:class 3 adenylate cyclase
MDRTPQADISEFLTGEGTAFDLDRIRTTILLTDIVGSTGQAASLGDEALPIPNRAHAAGSGHEVADHR